MISQSLFYAYEFPPWQGVTPGKVKFLIVAMDYFTKWIEAKAVATITGNQVKKFVWDNIVCRFGLPGEIVSDNAFRLGKTFSSPTGHGRERAKPELSKGKGPSRRRKQELDRKTSPSVILAEIEIGMNLQYRGQKTTRTIMKSYAKFGLYWKNGRERAAIREA
ncbi:reverse transcriptase domain-containing protein [Tanacetum coccineum]